MSDITVQGDDVYFSFSTSNGTVDGGPYTLTRLDSTSLLPVPELPPPSPGEYYLWMQGRGTDQPLVAIIGGNGASFARLVQDGTLVRLTSDGFSGDLLPSADGRLFFSNVMFDLTEVVGTTTTIAEVSCGAAGG